MRGIMMEGEEKQRVVILARAMQPTWTTWHLRRFIPWRASLTAMGKMFLQTQGSKKKGLIPFLLC